MIGHRILHRRIHKKLAFLILTGIGTVAGQTPTTIPEQPVTVRVDVTPGHVINSFDPDGALGSSIDVLTRKDIDKVYTPHILQESLSAAGVRSHIGTTASFVGRPGTGQRTELGVIRHVAADISPAAPT
jgi:hypothetical protein